MAEEHFEYVGGVLRTHGVSENEIEHIRFHYVAAMVHGYKHAADDMVVVEEEE